MTLLFMDGFDHLAAADYGSAGQTKWELGTAVAQIAMIPGRWGTGSAIQFSHGGGGAFGLRKNVTTGSPTGIFGFAYQIGVLNNVPICGLLDTGAQQVDLRLNATGTLSVTRNGTVLATSTFALVVGPWYWIEAKFIIHPTAGTVEIRVNGVTVINITPAQALSTRATANTSYNQIALDLTVTVGTAQHRYDDFFLLDDAGTTNNNFLGERRIFTLSPTGLGTTNALVIGGTTPAATNWQSVNQAAPDADVTYVTSATPGATDTYAFADLPANVLSIQGVQFNPVVRKDDVGVRTIAPVQRNAAGTEVAGATSTDLTATYFDKAFVNELSLVSGVAWTPAEINGSQFGIRIIT